MNIGDDEFSVTETHLSRKPAEGSDLVAAASLLAIMGFSLLFWSNYAGLAPQLPANGEQVFEQGQYWRLFTSLFIHADWKHLLSNAPGIAGLGYLLFGYFGFWVYPCITLIMGASITLISMATYPPHTNLIGASGVIYFMAAFWLTLYVCLERRHSAGKRILRATGFILIILIPTSYNPETSYRTHAIGFGVGVIVAAIYFMANRARFRRAEVIEMDRDEYPSTIQ